MLRVSIIIATLLIGVGVANAQQPGSPSRGPAYPSESQRGPAFPKSVSPTETNPTNWKAAPPPAEPVPVPRWLLWAQRRHRFR